MIELNQRKLDWASGIFDGEGCTSLAYSKNRPKTYCWVNLNVTNTCYAILTRFQIAVGGLGTIREVKKQQAHHKQCYVFTTSSFEEVQAIMCMIWPELGYEKRHQYMRNIRALRANNTGIDSRKRVKTHGTHSCYARGCRRVECKKAHAEYNLANRRKTDSLV